MEYILLNCGYGTTLNWCLTCLYGRALYFVSTFDIESLVAVIDFDLLTSLLLPHNCCKLELLFRCIQLILSSLFYVNFLLYHGLKV